MDRRGEGSKEEEGQGGGGSSAEERELTIHTNDAGKNLARRKRVRPAGGPAASSSAAEARRAGRWDGLTDRRTDRRTDVPHTNYLSRIKLPPAIKRGTTAIHQDGY